MFKKSSLKLVTLLSFILLVSLGCATLTNAVDNSVDAGGDTSDVAPAPTVDTGVLYADDFSSSSSGWDHLADEDGSTDYASGAYRIQITNPTKIFWANPGGSFGDVRVEVDATLVDGEWDNSYGIICRHADVQNFYALLVSSDGYYAIRKRVNGSELEIISEDGESYKFSDDIPQGNVTVRLAAECVGNTLRLYVNDVLIVEAIDGDIASGDVGLIATTFEATNTTIDFDNFLVTKP